jgi:hypothetical protein
VKTFKLSLVLALVLLPMSAFAAVPWTGNPGTATVDETAAGAYAQDNSSLDYNASGSTTTIVGRLNVTDTTATGYPSWTTMEIRAYDPSPNSEVRAKLIRTSAGGTVSTVATCATSDSAMVQTVTCGIPQVDFNSGYIYAVSIELSRTSTAVSPFIYGVRIY